MPLSKALAKRLLEGFWPSLGSRPDRDPVLPFWLGEGYVSTIQNTWNAFFIVILLSEERRRNAKDQTQKIFTNICNEFLQINKKENSQNDMKSHEDLSLITFPESSSVIFVLNAFQGCS